MRLHILGLANDTVLISTNGLSTEFWISQNTSRLSLYAHSRTTTEWVALKFRTLPAL